MAAVRRQDIAMMRLLTAHGASVSEEVRCDYTFHLGKCNRKTALLIAVCAEQLDMITELVASGADVNQSLGPMGTVLHFCYDHVEMVQQLVQLGADPNVTNDASRTAITLLLWYCETFHIFGHDLEACRSLASLLSVARDLDTLLLANRRIIRINVAIADELVALFLQHGARMRYCQMYLTGSSKWAAKLRKHREIQSERFIELLRAADTDFCGVRQRIASVDKDEWAPLNLAVLDQKLSQPLTLQASCVISVRRQPTSRRQ